MLSFLRDVTELFWPAIVVGMLAVGSFVFVGRDR